MLNEFGRIGRDALLRYTPSGTAVCNVALAYNYGRKGDDGERPTQWIEIAVWGKQAEALCQWFTKGRQLFVSVRDVRIESYAKQDGTQASKLVGDLVDVKFAHSGEHPAQQQYHQQPAQQTQQPVQQQQTSQQRPMQQPVNSGDGFDSNIPF